MENLDELVQTVALMSTDNTDEYFDVALRNRKYGKVDSMKGAILIDKYVTLFSSVGPYADVMQGTRRRGCCGPESYETDCVRPVRHFRFEIRYQIERDHHYAMLARC